MHMPSTIPPMTVRFNEETRDGVALLAKLTNRSRSYIINQAVKLYLAQNASYLQDLQHATKSIDTAPTYPSQDVFSWMRTWETKDEKAVTQNPLLHSKK